MSERQPAKHELELVAKVMGLTKEVKGHPRVKGEWSYWADHLMVHLGRVCDGSKFDPRRDERDLARLVEAMRAAGLYLLLHCDASGWHAEFWRYENEGDELPIETYKKDGDTQRCATFWAIVEALEEKEKRDADTDG